MMKKFSALILGAFIASTVAVGSYIIPNLSVTTAKLANLAVTAAKIANNTITTSQISTSAGITRSQLASLGQQVSSSSGSFTTTSATYVDVTNLTVTITTSGRPVLVALESDGTAADGPTAINNTGSPATVGLQIIRDSTVISIQGYGIGAAGSTATFAYAGYGNVFHVDPVAAGTYVYKVQAKKIATGSSISVNNAKLIAFEL